jgi:hypothetical protein
LFRDEDARLTRQARAVLPKHLAVPRVNFPASLSLGEVTQGRSNERQAISKSRGGVGQFIQKLQRRLVDSHSNSFHIGDAISVCVNFNVPRLS